MAKSPGDAGPLPPYQCRLFALVLVSLACLIGIGLLLARTLGVCHVAEMGHSAAESQRSDPSWEPSRPCMPPVVRAAQLEKSGLSTLVLSNVCLEEDTIVIHDPALLNARLADAGSGLPSFDTTRFEELVAHSIPSPHPLRPIKATHCKHDPLRFRYPSALEVRRAKHFTNCTVPVLIFGHWVHTFAEFFTRGPAWLWRLQQPLGSAALDEQVSLVLASCGSLPLQPHHLQLMQPFSAHPVSSWGAFANPVADTGINSGTQTCYSQMIVMGLDGAAWPATYDTAQHILGHYRDKHLVPDFKLFHSGPSVLKILFEYRAPDGSVHDVPDAKNSKPIPADDPELAAVLTSGRSHEPRLFHGKPVYPGVRQILNLADVLQQCNDRQGGWADSVVKGTKWTGVECRAYSFGRDLFEGMAVAQQADVFISMHGSGEMNAMFMRRGTLKIQLRSKEFGTVHRFFSNGYWPQVCLQSGFPFQCWFLNFDEDDTWEPGILERLGLYMEGLFTTRRDRHLRLKMQHLEYALKEILPLQSNTSEYKRRWDASQVAMTFNANHTVTYFQQMS